MSKAEKTEDELCCLLPEFPEQKLKLVLDVPISVNHMYYYKRIGKRTMPCMTFEAIEWFNLQRQRAELAVKRQGWQIEKKGVWLVADFDFYFVDKRTRDTHNCFKIVMDALEGVVYKNDYFVKPRVHKVKLDREKPRVEITIYAEKQEKEGD